MPTYNGERYLRETFASLAAQDERGFECIVVDGGSTDSTRDIIDEYSRQLDVQLFTRPELPNWVSKTNFAFERANAEHVCMLHHDDLWLSGRAAAVRRALLRHPDSALVLHPSLLIDADGRTLGMWTCPLDPDPIVYQPADLLERLMVQNFISVPSPTFRRDAAVAVGGIDAELWYTGDWDFYLKLARTGPSVYLDAPLSSFRIHGASLTMQGSADIDAFRRQLTTVLERHIVAIVPDARRRAVKRIANASNAINTALAAATHGSYSSLPGALALLAALGPSGWHSYFRESRIVERVASRLRARRSLLASSKA
jgi:cellulose synthase/poly-beta-1,6-N-acetylglucosamine synthase-like glycosyltransferase